MHQHKHSVRDTRRAIRHSTTATIDPAAKAELAKQKQAILDLFVEGEIAHWKIGLRYNHIVQEKLAEKAGYTHARDFFAAEVKAIAQATLSGSVPGACKGGQHPSLAVEAAGRQLRSR